MDLYSKNADGSGEERLLLMSENDKRPSSWSSDGRFLLYMDFDPKTAVDLWVLPDPVGPAKDPKPVPYLQTAFQEALAAFSPDGRWIAYLSTESGASQVYVRPFYPDRIAESAASGRWMVSKDSATGLPHWRADSKQLYFLTSTLQVVSVGVNADKSFQFESPRLLFSVPLIAAYDMVPDGKRLLIPLPEGTNAPSPFTVVTNWNAVLQK
jgi:Tol biopolymer transport system component